MKRILLSLSLIVAGVVLLNACVGAPAASTDSMEAEDVTVVYLGIGDSWVADNEWVPLIEAGAGVQMDYRMVPSPAYEEKRNVLMAAGDYPDVIRINPSSRQFKQYLNDGLLIPIDEYLDRYATVRDAFPAEVWENNRQADGKIYHIPRITGNLPRCLHYRTDWLAKLGMDEPTTLAEFRTFLERVRDEDPGNVGDPLIPFVPNRLDSVTWSMEAFLSAFGVDHLAWVPSPDDPDQLVFANTLPALKDGLQWVRELYADGLMDPTYMVATDRGLFKNEPPAYFDYRRDNVKWIDVPDDMMRYVQGVLNSALEEQRHINYLVDRDDATILDNLKALEDLANEFAAKVVLNPNLDIEAEWGSYLAALDANNLAAVTEAINRLNDIETINTMAAAITSPDDALE